MNTKTQNLNSNFAIAISIIAFALITVFVVFSVDRYHAVHEHASSVAEEKAKQVAATTEQMFFYGDYLLTGATKHIADFKTYDEAFKLLNAFDRESYGLGFIDNNKLYRVGSYSGIRKDQMSVADREYVSRAFENPHELTFGSPIVTRLTNLATLPISRGVFDSQGEFRGVLSNYVILKDLAVRIENLIAGSDVSYSISMEGDIYVLGSKELESKVIAELAIENTPLFVKVAYNNAALNADVMAFYKSLMLEVGFMSLILLLVGVHIKKYIISPAVKMQADNVKLTQQQLEMQRNADGKRRATRNLVHDMRTLTGIMVGFTQMIDKRVSVYDDPKIEQYLRLIQISGEDMMHMVSEMLDIEKSLNGALVLERSTITVHDLCMETLESFEPQMHAKNLRCTMDIAPDAPRLHADEKRFKRMVYNLVSNAVKYTRGGGDITLRYYVDNASCQPVLEIEDTGVGMSPEELKVAMAEYGCVASDLYNGHDSTGLGLPFVRCIAEAHGANFAIESTKEAAFSETAPTVAGDAPAEPMPDNVAVLPVGRKPLAKAKLPQKMDARHKVIDEGNITTTKQATHKKHGTKVIITFQAGDKRSEPKRHLTLVAKDA